MPDRSRGPAASVAAVAVVLLAVTASPAARGQDPADAAPVDLGAVEAPVRFVAPEGVVLELSSGRRVVDSVELHPAPAGDGMVVVAAMGIEDYVAGIAEMPARWPLEALKAQAVAARTYAWYQTARQTYRERGLPYDICATTACQVFEGRTVVEGPLGHRWQEAVDATAGEVLVFEGAPILARYFSTSGGRTRANEEVFPSSGAFPYLRGVEDPDDAVSPLHTWQAVFTRAQFDDLLSRGETLGAVTPIADAEVIPQGPGVPDRVVVTGRDGTTAEVTAGELKRFLDDVAPATFPADFPGPRSDGGRLPSTVPSSRYAIEVSDDRVVLDGRGWGHAVGLGQYGARGKADRGLGYREILATYYGGLEPTTPDALPDRVAVGLADDIDDLVVTADGPLTVRVGDRVLTRRGFGSWRVRASDDGTFRMVAPPGTGQPLDAAPTTTERTRPFGAEVVELQTVLNRPAALVAEVREGDRVVARRDVGVVDRGRRHAAISLATEDGPLPPGRYEAALLAVDEDGTVAGRGTPIEVGAIGGGTMASVLADRDPVAAPGTVPPVVPVVVAAVAGTLAGALVRRRLEVRA